jgi:hypothetical protein
MSKGLNVLLLDYQDVGKTIMTVDAAKRCGRAKMSSECVRGPDRGQGPESSA